jgi:cell division control protein 6
MAERLHYFYMCFQWKMSMKKQDLERMTVEIEEESSLFSDKSFLDTLAFPRNIVGRNDKTEELVRFLLGYKKGHVVPFISVYGRSGSGKSTVVKFVCEELDGISHIFVNLRKAKTVFGCANLVLAELGEPNLKSAQGLNLAIEKISAAIETRLKSGPKLFVIALDEFDVLFDDKRSKPSDFIYKLLVMEEKLREEGHLICIIAISNNATADFEIDDSVRSRIGSSEIFFNPYTRQDIFALLKDRAERALVGRVDEAVLEHCTDLSWHQHGDARRAIDLLRMAAEIAQDEGDGKIAKVHVDMASTELQKGRVALVISAASYHLRVAASSLARIEYLTDEGWHSTSTLYNQYLASITKETIPLGYRRFSELMTELVNSGIARSNTMSKGRHGYGTEFKLTVPPEIVGKSCSTEWWDAVVSHKKNHQLLGRWGNLRNATKRRSHSGSLSDDPLSRMEEEDWDDYVGPR